MAVEGLTYPQPRGMKSDVNIPSGPFDVWEGEWWRIPISAFHHGSWWHLAMNITSLWFLGALLEPRCSRLSYFFLLLGSATFTMLLQYLNGDYAVGISGTICAQLGALLVFRRRYPELQEVLSPPFIVVTMIMLASGLVINQFPEVMQGVGIANLAHFSGLGYGWLFGSVYSVPYVFPKLMRMLFWGMHIFIWPALNYSVAPIFNADYQWYRGFEANDLEESIRHYQTAANLDPFQSVYWDFLTQAQYQAGHRLAAWESCLNGLRHNRMDQRGVRLSRLIWANLGNRKMRLEALTIFEKVFGDEAIDWNLRLKLKQVISMRGRLVVVPSQSPSNANLLLTPSQRQLTLLPGSETLPPRNDQLSPRNRIWNLPQNPSPKPPSIDIDAPSSALEGVVI
ncbi:MAG: rhomboid family intramembrane serine protease [Planctomycetota bacterium]|nr:rhomboid family intramembrane serine protease [Planctomycetota bacterium]MDA1211524.1 rhomboid family intramembrane serine protease [Planctomycetota bacterium]